MSKDIRPKKKGNPIGISSEFSWSSICNESNDNDTVSSCGQVKCIVYWDKAAILTNLILSSCRAACKKREELMHL